jgi:hypothetical protein
VGVARFFIQAACCGKAEMPCFLFAANDVKFIFLCFLHKKTRFFS